MPDVKARRGFGCEVRTIWGHPQQFESIGICVTSVVQESEAVSYTHLTLPTRRTV